MFWLGFLKSKNKCLSDYCNCSILGINNLHDQEVASLYHLPLPDDVHLNEYEPAFLKYEVGVRLRAVCFNVDNIHYVHVVHHVLNSPPCAPSPSTSLLMVASAGSKGRGSPPLIYLSLSYLFIYAGSADSLY